MRAPSLPAGEPSTTLDGLVEQLQTVLSANTIGPGDTVSPYVDAVMHDAFAALARGDASVLTRARSGLRRFLPFIRKQLPTNAVTSERVAASLLQVLHVLAVAEDAAALPGLEAKARQPTSLERAVLAALLEAEGPMSRADVHERLALDAPPTVQRVYQVLEELSDRGFVSSERLLRGGRTVWHFVLNAAGRSLCDVERIAAASAPVRGEFVTDIPALAPVEGAPAAAPRVFAVHSAYGDATKTTMAWHLAQMLDQRFRRGSLLIDLDLDGRALDGWLAPTGTRGLVGLWDVWRRQPSDGRRAWLAKALADESAGFVHRVPERGRVLLTGLGPAALRDPRAREARRALLEQLPDLGPGGVPRLAEDGFWAELRSAALEVAACVLLDVPSGQGPFAWLGCVALADAMVFLDHGRISEWNEEQVVIGNLRWRERAAGRAAPPVGYVLVTSNAAPTDLEPAVRDMGAAALGRVPPLEAGPARLEMPHRLFGDIARWAEAFVGVAEPEKRWSSLPPKSALRREFGSIVSLMDAFKHRPPDERRLTCSVIRQQLRQLPRSDVRRDALFSAYGHALSTDEDLRWQERQLRLDWR